MTISGAVNYVTPARVKAERLVDGVVREFITDDFLVDVAGLPELVARGVMPFKFLRMRKDFKKRFKGCEDGRDVNRVLAAEGYYKDRKK